MTSWDTACRCCWPGPGFFAGDADVLGLLTDAQLLGMRQIGPVALARVRGHIACRVPSRRAPDDSGGLNGA